MGQGYSTHLIIRLDADAGTIGNADRLVEKADLQEKASVTKRLDMPANFNNAGATSPDVLTQLMKSGPPIKLDAESKITVIGHGDDDSQFLGDAKITPVNLVRLLSALAGRVKVKRISLMQCRGGGWMKRMPALGKAAPKFIEKIAPGKSFGHEFAAHAGILAASITARTGDVRMAQMTETINSNPSVFIWKSVGDPNEIGPKDLKGYRGQNRKVIFMPADGSGPKNRLEPAWKYEDWSSFGEPKGLPPKTV
jgi:hypothetical protein